MAHYVFSDVHGHAAPLKRLLERLELGPEDRLYMLGDMIDRGPHSAEVLKLCKEDERISCLLGNHEDLMLTSIMAPDDEMAWLDWGLNGGQTTYESLMELEEDERTELLSWVAGLPLYMQLELEGKQFLLVHAGLNLEKLADFELETNEAMEAYLAANTVQDLLWTREDYWQKELPENFGATVISGHTPVLYLPSIASEQMAQDLQLDPPSIAFEKRGEKISRIDIDCAAAAGAGIGRVALLRLEDMHCFYEDILEGE